MRQLIAILIAIAAFSCSSPEKQETSLLKGKWVNADKTSTTYITLDFQDTSVVFDNRSDTINRFTYRIDSKTHTLYLTDPFNKKDATKIVGLSNDSLIFNHLWAQRGIQRFYRKAKKK